MSSLLEKLEVFSNGKFQAFRNIATCDPTQDLYDDIADEADIEVLQYIDNLTSGIDHNQSPVFRFHQYGQIENSLVCFEEKFWSFGRFGRRNYGVWYGALEEETSVLETLHHRPEIDQNDLKNAIDPIIQARRMFRAELQSPTWIDLRPQASNYPLILDSDDYEFCQDLGAAVHAAGIGMLLTPSVRNSSGTCTPVFDPKVILSDQAIRSYFFHFPLDGSESYYSTSNRVN